MTRSGRSKSSAYARENAQRRRNEEAYWFSKLSECLPLPASIISKLDKGKLLRLAINYIRMKKYTQSSNDGLVYDAQLCRGPKHDLMSESNLMLDILGGFLIFINRRGVIYYVSEQVEKHLGISQVDLIGKNVFHLLHEDDQNELFRQNHEHPTCRSAISCQTKFKKFSVEDWAQWDGDNDDEEMVDPSVYVRERLFSLRMKCHVARKCGNVTKQVGYCLIQWSGRMKLEDVQQNCCRVLGLVAICRPMSVPLVEIRMMGNMFTSQHRLDMRFTYCDSRIFSLIGYKPEELIGKTVYQFHNPQDVPKIHNCHSNLIVKGTSVSKYYRFLGKTGVWVWMQTRATVITNSDGSQYIICMNFIIGEEEGRRCLMMEQEEKGLKAGNNVDDNALAAIDITAINSPVSAHSSGYSSADDENLITHNNCSQFSPFSPDEDFVLSFPDAGLGEVGPNGSVGKDNPLALLPMPSFDELIDFDTGIDGMASYYASTPPISNGHTLLAVSSVNGSLQVSSSPTVVSANNGQSVAQASLRSNALNSLAKNNNFDNDIEMMDTSEDGDSNSKSSRCESSSPASVTKEDQRPSTNNIIINLPPGFNPKGQDGKSLLLDVLRKADKTQLLKIHEQINAAMASISQCKTNGKQATPELQISITPAASTTQLQVKSCTPSPSDSQTQQTSAMSTSPIFSFSNMKQNDALNKSPQISHLEAVFSSAPETTRASTPMDVAGTSLDNISTMFTDIDAQFPVFDMLDNMPGNNNGFTDGLLNDVNLGVTVSMMTSPASSSHVSKISNLGGANTVVSASPNKVNGILRTEKPIQNGTCPQLAARYSTNSPVKSPVPQLVRTRQQSRQSNDSDCGCASEQDFDMAAAVRGLDDHSYTSKFPSRKHNEHVKFAPPSMDKLSSRLKNAPVLEHLLLTKRPINPMKGSDHVAQRIQQIALGDMESHNGLNQPNLLKKLLTGEMDKTQGGICPQRPSIYTRRGGSHSLASVSSFSSGSSAGSLSPSSCSSVSSPPSRISSPDGAQSSQTSQLSQTIQRQSSQPRNINSSLASTSAAVAMAVAVAGDLSVLDADLNFDEAAMLGTLDFLNGDGVVGLDSIWSTTPKDSASSWNTSAKSDNEEIFGDINELLQGETHNEIDDILRQETRHEEEWMKQFLDELL